MISSSWIYVRQDNGDGVRLIYQICPMKAAKRLISPSSAIYKTWVVRNSRGDFDKVKRVIHNYSHFSGDQPVTEITSVIVVGD